MRVVRWVVVVLVGGLLVTAPLYAQDVTKARERLREAVKNGKVDPNKVRERLQERRAGVRGELKAFREAVQELRQARAAGDKEALQAARVKVRQAWRDLPPRLRLRILEWWKNHRVGDAGAAGAQGVPEEMLK